MKTSVLSLVFASLGLFTSSSAFASRPVITCNNGGMEVVSESNNYPSAGFIRVTDDELVMKISKSYSLFSDYKKGETLPGTVHLTVGERMPVKFYSQRKNGARDAEYTLDFTSEYERIFLRISQVFDGLCYPDSDGYQTCIPAGYHELLKAELKDCAFNN